MTYGELTELLKKQHDVYLAELNGVIKQIDEPLYSSILGKYINPATGEVVETKENE
jgi:hypothetical protein